MPFIATFEKIFCARASEAERGLLFVFTRRKTLLGEPGELATGYL